MAAKNRLFVSRLRSIGAVEDGDNPAAEIMLYKARDKVDKHSLPGSIDAQVDTVRRAWREQNPEKEDGPFEFVDSVFPSFIIVESGDDTFQVPYTVSDDGVSFGVKTEVQLDTEIVTKVDKTDPGQGLPITEKTMADLDLTTLEDELRAEVEKAITDRDTQIVELTKAAEKAAEGNGDGDGDPVLEGLSEEAAVRFADLEKSNKATAEALVKERDARKTAEWVGKARTDYPHILKDAEDAGPHLKVLTDTDSADWLLAKLKDFEAVLAASDLFKELGAADGGTAIDKINELAKEIRKDNPKLSGAQSRKLARDGNPDLKAAEREERKS